MSRKTRDQIKVIARNDSVRAAGRWFDRELQIHPALREKVPADNLKFIKRLSCREGACIRMDRTFANEFVSYWAKVFIAMDRTDLLVCVDDWEKRAPVEGIRALAELVADIAVTLRRGRGSPEKLDSWQVLEAVERTRQGAPRGQKTEAVDSLAQALGVSPNTLEKTRRAGKAQIRQVREALAGTLADPAINPNAEKIILTDASGTSGVVAVILRDVA